MSHDARLFAGILLVTVPTVAFGGGFLLRMIARRIPGYLDNPVRQALFRAGHAHAGVLILLALVGMILVDHAALPSPAPLLARIALAAAPILMPAGFFFSVLSPSATRPGRAIALVFAGAISLAAGTVTLGLGLLRSL